MRNLPLQKKLVFVGLALTLLVGFPFQSARAQLQDPLAQGAQKLQAGDFAEARVLLDRALTLYPDRREAYLFDAQAHVETGDLEGAEAILQDGLTRFPDDLDLLTQAGVVALNLGKYDRAIARLQKARKKNPFSATIRQALGLAYFNKGVVAQQSRRLLQARKDYLRALHFLPNDVRPLQNLAVVYISLNQPDSALIYVKEARKRAPGNSTLLALEAKIYQMKQNVKGLESSLVRLYEQNPDSLQIGLDLATVYLAEHKTDKAEKVYQQLMRRHPHDRRPVEAAVHYFRDHFNYEKVIAYYDAFLKANPGDRWALLGKADAYEAQGNWQQAAHIYRKLLAKNPNDREVLTRLANLYRNAKQWAAAAKTLHLMISKKMDDKVVWYLLGDSYRNLARFDDAIRAYQKATEVDSFWSPAWISLGKIYDLRGNALKAQKAYRMAVHVGTAEPLPYHRLAEMALARGDSSAFRRLEKKAVKKAIQAILQLQGTFQQEFQTIQGLNAEKMSEARKNSDRLRAYRTVLQEALANLMRDPGCHFESFLDGLLQRYPGAKFLWETKAQLALKKGNQAAALAAYRREVQLDASNYAAQIGLARVLVQMGRTKEAILTAERAHALKPFEEEPYQILLKLYQKEGRLDVLRAKWQQELAFHPDWNLLRTYLQLAEKAEKKER